MKAKLLLLFLLVFVVANGQVTVNYTETDAPISNPERGFFKFLPDVTSTSAPLLDVATLQNYRTVQQISVVRQSYYLGAFLNGTISDDYLTMLQANLTRVRAARLKMVLRFAYGYGNQDATKAKVLEHITQLAGVLSTNADIICAIEAGFIGGYGEWYYTNQAEFGGYGYNNTPITTEQFANRREVVDALLAVTTSPVLVRTPWYKKGMYGTTPLNASNAFTSGNASRVGYHDDAFLNSGGTYQDQSDIDYAEQETAFFAQGGETYDAVSATTGCEFAVPELRKFHFTFLNVDKPAYMQQWTDGGCLDDIKNALGYRLALSSSTAWGTMGIGQQLPLTLRFYNRGYAAPFSTRTVYLVFKNVNNGLVERTALSIDPRTLLSDGEIVINELVDLPPLISEGNYRLYLSLPDQSLNLGNLPEYAIQLANDGMWDAVTGYNDLNREIEITSLSISEQGESTIKAYPVPCDREIYFDINDLQSQEIAVFNTLGQTIFVTKTITGNRLIVATGDLAAGHYILKSSGLNGVMTTRFIVVH